MGSIPGLAEFAHSVKSPLNPWSTRYWLSEPGIGLGLAITPAGGVVGWPLPSDQKKASPEPSIIWLAPVPPMTDWWKLSLIVYWSASFFKTGTSPFCTL